MKNLSEKLGDMTFDGLITDVSPEVVIGGATIRKLGTAATIKRGTIMAKSSTDGKLVILGTTAASGETLDPYAVICDDIDVGTSADVAAPVYIGGCFDPNKLTVASGYTITEADKDKLRAYVIIFKAALEM